MWPTAPEKKSLIQLPCVAYRTEYNAKYKDHPALQEIVHAGKVQPCCQVSSAHEEAERAIGIEAGVELGRL